MTKFSARNGAVYLGFDCRQHYYHTTLAAVLFGIIALTCDVKMSHLVLKTWSFWRKYCMKWSQEWN